MRDIFWDHFLASLFPTRILKVTTRSGRLFRFNLTDFRVFPTTTDIEIDGIASRIVAEKYRECQWDRAHPHVNSELEIREAVYDFLRDLVKDMRQHQERRASQGKTKPIFVGQQTILTSTVRYRRNYFAERRMRKVLGVFNNAGQLLHTFGLNEQQRANEHAAQLSESRGVGHYVRETKVPLDESAE